MITDFELHAFVDGELASEECGCVLDEATRSAELAARLNDLRNLKQLIRIAYGDAEHPKPSGDSPSVSETQQNRAAAVGRHLASRS